MTSRQGKRSLGVGSNVHVPPHSMCFHGIIFHLFGADGPEFIYPVLTLLISHLGSNSILVPFLSMSLLVSSFRARITRRLYLRFRAGKSAGESRKGTSFFFKSGPGYGWWAGCCCM